MLGLNTVIETYWKVKNLHPVVEMIARPAGWIVKGADTVLAGALVGGWALGRMLVPPPRAEKPAHAGAVCFLSYEGFAVAPTRVRAYYFADQVARAGVPTRVLAFWDHVFHYDHLPPRLLLGVEKALAAIRTAELLLADPPAAIVHQRPNYDLITGWMVHRLRGTPLIFDIDDWILDEPWFFPLRLRHVYRWSRAMVSVCVVSSDPLEQALRPLFGSTRVVQLPTFVDVAMFRPRATPHASREIVFGWNGTLFQEFMLEPLLEMLRAFRRACGQLDVSTPVRLEIAGTGGFFDELAEILETEFAGAPIVIKGWVDPRAMGEYLDGIDVGLYSLKEPGGDTAADRHASRFLRSKSPTKVFEYMAKGIPTISTRFGEVGRFLEDGVTGFCSDDPEALTRAFVTLARDAALRERMGAAARELCVEQYSLEVAGQTLANLIAEVVASSAGAPGSADAVRDVPGVPPQHEETRGEAHDPAP
jgi:glycosyltransferase involved in cell wall biosynthesis